MIEPHTIGILRTRTLRIMAILLACSVLSLAHPASVAASDLTFELTTSATMLQVGQRLNVTVRSQTIPDDCDFLAYDITLLIAGGPTPPFALNSPANVGPPVAATTNYTLTAVAPGVVELRASVFGEVYCGGWSWSYRNSNSVTVTVTGDRRRSFLALVAR
jgi:hypothetical protein